MSDMILGIELNKEFRKKVYCMNTTMNPHYPWNNPEFIKVQADVSAYDTAYKTGDKEFLQDAERKALGGQDGYKIGVNVESPWGDNKVLEATNENNEDIVKKEITVKPGFMLSLQRHRGRQELWEVKSGTLTVISDGKVHEVTAGNSISLPKGNVHCMINRHDEPVTVIETQRGFCREADNVRLVDFNNRPTVPLLTKTEAESAILYAEIQDEIAQKFDHADKPNPKLLSPEYKQDVSKLEL